MKNLTWTTRDAALAEAEGWNIFNEDTCPEIQRDDEAAKFRSDDDAVAFVTSQTSAHCKKALALVAAARQPL